MPFTAGELGNATNALLDFYMRGPALSQRIQEKPVLKKFKAFQKSFPGGAGNIKMNVKGDYSTVFSGYTHDDTVEYVNPANIKQISFPWYELHGGISMTFTELKRDGISVVDSLNGEETTEHSDMELSRITSLLKDKLEDMSEGIAQSLNEIFWLDGSRSSTEPPGIRGLLSQSPNTGIVGGGDRAANRWWRNRARVGALTVESGYTSIDSITGPEVTAS